jgi:DNA polymerase III subunit gamma/tau
MAYLVLARKYRPQSLEDVSGQDHVTTTLRNAISGDRVAHAYLFTGARGVGKTSSARILAKALNCTTGPTITPCNTCDNCKEITEGNSLDVFEIDAASNTGVDNVRELQDGLRYLPSKARFKIYIIDEVHMLSTAAFNALLKTLEEPPPHVRFIFATTEPHKIPVTILSRCQRFDFKRLSRARIVEVLTGVLEAEGVSFTPGALQILAREAEGSMRDALSLTDQALSFGGGKLEENTVASALGIVDREILGDAVKGILGGDAQALLEIVDKVYDYGYDVRQFTRNLLESFRHLLVVRVAGDVTRLVDLPPEDIEELRVLAADAPVDRLHRLFSALLKMGEDVSRGSHPRMILEVGLIRLATLGALQPVEELMGRLRDMAAQPPPIAGGLSAFPTLNPPSNAPGGPSPAATIGLRGMPEPRTAASGLRGMPEPRQPAPSPVTGATHSAPPAPSSARSAPPPPPARAAGVVVSESAVPKPGEDFKAYVQRTNLKLAAQMRSIQVQTQGKQLVMLVPKDQSFLQTLFKGAMEKDLLACAQAFLGPEATLDVRLNEKASSSPVDEPSRRQPVATKAAQISESERRRRGEASDHPLVQQVLKVFEGSTIVDVHMLAEPIAPLAEPGADDGSID